MLIKNGKLVNVCTGEIYGTDISISNGKIMGVRIHLFGFNFNLFVN